MGCGRGKVLSFHCEEILTWRILMEDDDPSSCSREPSSGNGCSALQLAFNNS